MQLLCGFGGLVMNMFYNLCAVFMQKNGIENITIYSMVKCGSDGLVMTKKCDFYLF